MFSIIKEEWRAVWRDEGVALIVVFALFIYGISYSLGYGGEVLDEVPIAVVVEKEGAASRRLIEMLDASPKLCVAHCVADMDAAEALLRERKVWGIIALSPDLERDILAERQARVAILGDASYFLAYREVLSGAVATIQQMNAEIIERRHGFYNPPIIYEQRNLFNPSLGYGIFVMPAIILLIVQQTALIGIGMVSATRREQGFYYVCQSGLVITVDGDCRACALPIDILRAHPCAEPVALAWLDIHVLHRERIGILLFHRELERVRSVAPFALHIRICLAGCFPVRSLPCVGQILESRIENHIRRRKNQSEKRHFTTPLLMTIYPALLPLKTIGSSARRYPSSGLLSCCF